MINSYDKGRRKERQIVNEAREMGCIALRSAGSKSPIDVVIIDTESREITFVQSKAYEISQAKREALIQEFNKLNGAFQCRFQVR